MMDPVALVVPLLLVHAALGGLDTVVSHEWRGRLPATPGTGPELRLHAMRSSLYALLFASVAAGDWRGAAALWPLAVSGLELAVTARDTVVESRLRRILAFERINHLLLLVNSGAYTLAIALSVAQPGGFEPVAPGVARGLLWLAAAVAAATALRETLAARRRLREDAPYGAARPAGATR
ncbi:MAG TPA: hypothetical protein VEA81_12860 [Burkholderiaceae bacterium]|nr:hypothetical protein [Burkholderiaceae bacterium]